VGAEDSCSYGFRGGSVLARAPVASAIADDVGVRVLEGGTQVGHVARSSPAFTDHPIRKRRRMACSRDSEVKERALQASHSAK